MIYVVAHTKGGVGKSTTAVHLAAMLARTHQVLLIDGDSQPTSAGWAACRAELTDCGPSPVTRRLAGEDVLNIGRVMSRDFDHTVIDVGGRDSVALRSALVLAEMVIIPSATSDFDGSAMTDLQEILKEAQEYNPALKVRVLLNRLTGGQKHIDDALAYLKEENLPALKTTVRNRVAFWESVGKGFIVHEAKTAKKSPGAIEEMDKFFAEVTA